MLAECFFFHFVRDPMTEGNASSSARPARAPLDHLFITGTVTLPPCQDHHSIFTGQVCRRCSLEQVTNSSSSVFFPTDVLVHFKGEFGFVFVELLIFISDKDVLRIYKKRKLLTTSKSNNLVCCQRPKP